MARPRSVSSRRRGHRVPEPRCRRASAHVCAWPCSAGRCGQQPWCAAARPHCHATTPPLAPSHAPSCRHCPGLARCTALLPAAPQHAAVASACASRPLPVPSSCTWACQGYPRVVSPLTALRHPAALPSLARVHVSLLAALARSACTRVASRVPPKFGQASQTHPLFSSLLYCLGHPSRAINPAWRGHVHLIRCAPDSAFEPASRPTLHHVQPRRDKLQFGALLPPSCH